MNVCTKFEGGGPLLVNKEKIVDVHILKHVCFSVSVHLYSVLNVIILL